MFSSDNGGPLPGRVTDNGRFREGKHTLYEGGVRVCAFATWDGHLKAGSVEEEPVHIVDWYPTLLKLCGASLEQPLPLDGHDIWPVLTEGQPSPHKAILLNTEPDRGAVRVGDWKLVLKQKGQKDESIELFNLKTDPSEKTNLADREPSKTADLRLVLDDFARQAAPPKSKPMPKNFVVPAVWGESGSKTPE